LAATFGLARAAQVEAIAAFDGIERSTVVEIGKASPFARKIARFRLDRDIFEDQITLFGEGCFMLQGNMAKSDFLILCIF
jgi:hypothetical protein